MAFKMHSTVYTLNNLNNLYNTLFYTNCDCVTILQCDHQIHHNDNFSSIRPGAQGYWTFMNIQIQYLMTIFYKQNI